MNDTNNDDSIARDSKTVDKEAIENANEILNSLEKDHRSDLSLHLYSSFLLKQLLYKANERKHWFEVDQFFRTQVKHNWTSWPSYRTIIDPQTSELYVDGIIEDTQEKDMNLKRPENSQTTIKRGQISNEALIHSTNMLRLELDSFWQHCLTQSSSKSHEVLDIDKLGIPKNISDDVIDKLDRLFNGLHNKVAKTNKINIQQRQTSPNVTIIQSQNKKVKIRRAPILSYHDIINEGCEMGEDMVEIYMKSLELYNDIPSKIEKGQFKLPKAVLKKYRPAKKGKSGIYKLEKSREQFLSVQKLLKDKRLSAQDKIRLRKISGKEIESAIESKTFFMVKGMQSDEKSEDVYNLDDCLAKIPRN